MKTDKKILPVISLYNYKGDLSKKWFIYWYDGGKRVQKYRGINLPTTIAGRTAAANRLIKEYQQKLKTEINGFGRTQYVRQYKKITSFIERKRPTWRTTTASQIDSRMRIFFEWNQRNTITKERIELFLDYLYGIGRKQNTVAGYYLILRNVIGNSLGQDLLEGLHVKKGGGIPARYFSHAQVKFLAKEISKSDKALWLGVRFIFYCFIRPKELRLLKVADILLEESKICIPATVSKNKKTQYVVIPDAFLENLKEKLTGRNPAEYLIAMGDGFTPIGKNLLKNRHQKLLKQLHFDTDRFKLYSWKHTGAVMAVKNGVHIKQLQFNYVIIHWIK